MTVPVRMAEVRVDIDFSDPALEDVSLATVPAEGLDTGEASRVALHVTAEEISCYERYGDDLVVVLRSGERLWLRDFFQSDDNGVAQLLVLEEAMDGFAEISLAEDGDGCLMPTVLSGAAGAALGDGAMGGALPIGVGAAGVAGLAAVAFAATGGSGKADNGPETAKPGTDGNATDGKPGGETEIDEEPEAPQGPVIEDLAVTDNGDGTITVSGRCEEGATVRVAFTRGPDVKVDVEDDGRFSVHSPAGFAQRDGTVVVQATLGDVTGPEKMIDYIDTITPPAPTIDGARDADGVEGAAITPDSRIVFTGTGEPTSTVTIQLQHGDAEIIGGSATVGMDGKWSIEYGHVELKPFTYTVTAVQEDINGNTSVRSDAFDLNVQPSSPEGPVEPVDPGTDGDAEGGDGDDGGETGALSGPVVTVLWARENADGSIRVGGGTEPGANVTIRLPDGSQIKVTADANGAFETNSAVGVSQPDGSVYAQAEKDGDVGPVEMVFYEATDDGQPDQKPGDGGQTGGSETDETGGTEGNETPAGPQVTELVLGSNVDGTISISGRCDAGSTVEVIFPDGATVSVDAGSDGKFDVESPAGVAQPEGTVRIVAIKDEIRGPEVTASYVDHVDPLAPVIDRVDDDTGVEDDGITFDTTLVFCGTGETGATVAVSLERDGKSVKIGDAIVDENREWRLDHRATELDQGEYVVTARQTDINGRVSPQSSAFGLTVDADAPSAPVIHRVEDDTGVEDDGITSDTTLAFCGTGEPGATVVVSFVRGNKLMEIGDAVVADDGSWRVDHTDTALQPGDYLVKARQTDASGLLSPLSATFELSVDTAEPSAPVISHVEDDTGVKGDGITSDTTLVFHGSGEPGARVVLFQEIDGTSVEIGDAIAGENGRWSVDFTDKKVVPGDYVVKAQQTGVNGLVSSHSYAFELTVEPAAPVEPGELPTPHVTGIAEQAVVLGHNFIHTSDRTVTILGEGEPGAHVDVYLDQKGTGGRAWIGEAAVQDDGTWQLDYTHATLALDRYQIQARHSGVNGGSSEFSDIFTLNVIPDAPVITGIDEDTGESATDGVTRDTTPATYGTNAEPGALIELYEFEGGGYDKLGEAHAEADGTWRVDLAAAPLPEGDYVLRARQTSAGMTSETSGGYKLVIEPAPDMTVPPAPIVTGIAEDATILPNGLYTTDRRVTFVGEGEPGARVAVYVDPKGEGERSLIGEKTVPDDGTWQMDYTNILLEMNDYDVQARQTGANGMTSSFSDSLTLHVIPETPIILGVNEDTGESATDGVTSDGTLEINGVSGEPGALVELFVFDGETREAFGQARVDADRNWRIDNTDTALPEGEYVLTVRQTTDTGVISMTGGGFRLIVEPADQAAPEVEGLQLSKDGDGGINISGHCEAGSTVLVRFPDGSTVSETAGSDNGFFVESPAGVAQPEGTVRVEAMKDGVKGSQATIAYVDNFDPLAPVIEGAERDTGLAEDGVTSETTFVFHGTGEPGATVVVSLEKDGEPVRIGDALVGTDGTWRLDHTDTGLTPGEYAVTAQQTDVNGRVSTESESLRLRVDTAPPAPIITHVDSDTGVAGDGITSDTTLVFHGTGQPGATVAISLDSNGQLVPMGAAFVDEDGTWRIDRTDREFEPGDYVLTAQQSDVTGLWSWHSPAFELTVEGAELPVPHVTGIAEETAVPGLDSVRTSDQTVTFLGEGEPGARVEVYLDRNGIDGRVRIGEAPVGNDGSWQLDYTHSTLALDEYVVQARHRGANGGRSEFSDGFTLDVVPEAPVILGVDEDTGDSAIDGKTSDTTPAIYGNNGEPGAQIEVQVFDGRKHGTFGEARVAADGSWRVEHTGEPLPEGLYILKASQTSETGMISNTSGDYQLVVDPAATGENGDGGEGEAPLPAPVISGIDQDTGKSADDGVTSDMRLETHGTNGEPGALLTLYLADGIGYRRIGETRVEQDGTWRVDHTDVEMPKGEYELAARQENVEGTKSEMSGGYQLVVKPLTSQTLSITGIDEDTGVRDSDGVTQEAEPAFWIEGGKIGNTLVVTVDGREVGRTVVESDSPMLARYSGEEPLDDGGYEALVTEISPEGIASEASRAFAFTVDTLAPATPSVTGVSPDTGESSTDGWTNANQLVIEGRGEPGEAVRILVDGRRIGETTVEAEGSWQFDYSYVALAQGEHEITALQGDVAGNRSAMSRPFSVNIDRTADAPRIDGVTAGDGNDTPGGSEPTVVRIEPSQPGSPGMGRPGVGDVEISRIVSGDSHPLRRDAGWPDENPDAVSGGNGDAPLPAGSHHHGGASLPTFTVTTTINVPDRWDVQEADPDQAGGVFAAGQGGNAGAPACAGPVDPEAGTDLQGGAAVPTLDVGTTINVPDRWDVQKATARLDGDDSNPLTPESFFSGVSLAPSPAEAPDNGQDATRAFGLEKGDVSEMSELLADDNPDAAGLVWAFPEPDADMGPHGMAGHDPSGSALPDWDHATFM